MPVPRPCRVPFTLFLPLLTASLAIAGCGARAPEDVATPHDGGTRAADAGLPLRMSPREAHAFIAQHPEVLVLDVRNNDEWNGDLGHIAGSKLIPLRELGGRLDEIEAWKDKPILVVSRTGDRGGAGVVALREAGFKQVAGLDGGIDAWRTAGY